MSLASRACAAPPYRREYRLQTNRPSRVSQSPTPQESPIGIDLKKKQLQDIQPLGISLG